MNAAINLHRSAVPSNERAIYGSGTKSTRGNMSPMQYLPRTREPESLTGRHREVYLHGWQIHSVHGCFDLARIARAAGVERREVEAIKRDLVAWGLWPQRYGRAHTNNANKPKGAKVKKTTNVPPSELTPADDDEIPTNEPKTVAEILAHWRAFIARWRPYTEVDLARDLAAIEAKRNEALQQKSQRGVTPAWMREPACV